MILFLRSWNLTYVGGSKYYKIKEKNQRNCKTAVTAASYCSLCSNCKSLRTFFSIKRRTTKFFSKIDVNNLSNGGYNDIQEFFERKVLAMSQNK